MIVKSSALILATPKPPILTHTTRIYSFPSRQAFDFAYPPDNSQNLDLSFLPIEVDYLPPKTDLILRKATLSYIQGDEKQRFRETPLTLRDVLQCIDDEYLFTYLPVIVDKFTLDPRSDPNILAFCKILSFSVFNRLPMEIALVLMDELPVTSMDNSLIQSLKACLQQGGWRVVSFPRGLTLRLKRSYVSTNYEKYFPLPRKTFLTRSQDVVKASQAIKEAAATKPPIKRKRRDEIFTEMENVKLGRSYMAESAQSIVSSNFFPTRRRLYKRIQRSVQQYSTKVISDRNGGFVVYLLLRLVWSSWRFLSRLPLFYPMIPLVSTLDISTKLRGIYILSIILSRLIVSVVLSPSAEEAFRFLIKLANIRFETAEKLLKVALFCDCVLFVTQIFSR